MFRPHHWPLFCLLATLASPAAAEQPLEVGTRRELFVDGAIVGELRDGAELRMHRPTPRGVAIVHDAPWEGNASLYHTVFRDGDRYRMYYRGWNFDVSGEKLAVTHRPVVCYAESRDGITWTKPELGLVEFEGSKDNNVLWDGVGSHNFAPFLDGNPDCPPDERYKALGGVKSEGGLHAFASADGIHWRKLADEPVITKGAFDSQNVAFWDAERSEYRSYQRDFREGRDVTTSRSRDFLEWTEPEFLEYEPGRLTQLYTNQITPYHRAPHLLLGFPTRYVTARDTLTPLNAKLKAITKRFGTDYTDGGFMASRDRRQFRMWGDAFIRPGPVSEDRWVYGANYQNHGVVETASDLPAAPPELSLYASEAYWEGPGVRMRRYTLRLDGFVSVNAPFAGGEVVTNPLVFAAPESEDERQPDPVSPFASGPIVVEKDRPLRGKRSLRFRRPDLFTIPGTKKLGGEATFACLVREVPRGHRRLFSAYDGGATKPGEFYFDLDVNDAGLRFGYDGLLAEASFDRVSDLYEQSDRPHHLAATYRDGEITLYLDGQPVGDGGKAEHGPLAFALGDVRFGEDYPPTSVRNEPFAGVVDDVLVLPRALSAKEVAELAESGADETLDLDEQPGVLYTFEGAAADARSDRLPHDGRQDLVVSGLFEPGDVELLVNYATSAAGGLRCEIQDADGQPIPGYTLDESDVVYGDHVERPLSWRGSSEVKPLVGKPIRLRFVLSDADLYSFRFGPGSR